MSRKKKCPFSRKKKQRQLFLIFYPVWWIGAREQPAFTCALPVSSFFVLSQSVLKKVKVDTCIYHFPSAGLACISLCFTMSCLLQLVFFHSHSFCSILSQPRLALPQGVFYDSIYFLKASLLWLCARELC